MSEVATQIFPHRVEYLCDACRKGTMRPTGMVLTSHPPQYPHRCTACDASMTSLKQYPCIEWRDAPQN